MSSQPKAAQIQLRVGSADKRELQRRSKASGMSLSAFILAKALLPKGDTFQDLLDNLAHAAAPSFALAALSDFLGNLVAAEFHSSLGPPERAKLSPFLKAYVAAMVEHAAARKQASVPAWVLGTRGIQHPWFASELRGLRLHLLTSAPAAFRRRNLFVDASVGDRV